MRLSTLALLALLVLPLAACTPSLLIGTELQSRLMYALLKPLVGFDPSQVHLFAAPLVRERLQHLLGDKFEPALALLNTATQIQQEGALFYVLSRYTPPEVKAAAADAIAVNDKVKAIADTAAMVWNADTNQLAVMLVQDNAAEIIAEQAAAAREALVPALPAEVRTIYETAVALQQEVEQQQRKLQQTRDAIDAEKDELQRLIEQVDSAR